MSEKTRLSVTVVDDSADPQGLHEATSWLRDELLHLDVVVSADGTDPAPAGARADLALTLGGLVIALTGTEVLGSIVGAITAWLGRNQHRSVKLELDGDVLEVTGVRSDQQRELIDAWLRRRQTDASPASGRRLALIVAGDEYRDPGLRRLRAPAQDAEALARVLGDESIGGFDVRTLLNESTSVVNEAVEEFFADRHPDDLLLLHFSGHGVKNDSGDLYFATTTTKLHRLGATAVAAEFVNRQMSRSRCRRVVLLLDCCYAGAFARGALPRAGATLHVEDQFGGRGRVVITASNALEYAFDGLELADEAAASPSVFTRALVDGLETGLADRDQDGYVGVHELYDYVYDRVRAATPKQTPGKWTFDVQGDLIIARRGRPVAEPTPLPDDLLGTLEHPLAKVRSGAVEELERLLRGRHAGLALAARLALEQLVDDDSRMVSQAATKALSAAGEASADVPSPIPSAVPKHVGARQPAPEAPLSTRLVEPPEPEDRTDASVEPTSSTSATGSSTMATVPEAASYGSPVLRGPALMAAFFLLVGSVLLPSLSSWPRLTLALRGTHDYLVGLPLPHGIVIWALALAVAATAVGLLREGRLRNAALGAAAGLGAVELGLLAGLGGLATVGDDLEIMVIMVGVALILPVVFLEAVRSQPDAAARVGNSVAAIISIVMVILLVSHPFGVLRAGNGGAVVSLLLVAAAALLLRAAKRPRAGRSRLPILFSVVTALLLFVALAKFPTTSEEVDGVVTAYSCVLFVLLALAVEVVGEQPETVAVAQVVAVFGLLTNLIIASPFMGFIVVLLVSAGVCAAISAVAGMPSVIARWHASTAAGVRDAR
ncbi:caspase family protein [Nonomuraea sp. NPDC049504]|uniref:caspase family protein n=1 Tax=Nonomuraea sp. NPDC049504 TaxID=3154729 RepID=UPI00342D26CE